jgi:hypothetical protein
MLHGRSAETARIDVLLAAARHGRSGALALLDLGLGRYGAALDRFEMTATGALRHYIQPILFAPDQIEAAVRSGAAGAAASAADRAAEPLARFAAWAEATGQPWARVVLHRCQALAGDGDADGHFREALRQHEVSGRPFEHARTALLYGEWLRRGRRAQTPAPTCEPRSRCSTGPGPHPGPNGPGPSCARRESPWPPGRRRRTG